MSSACGWMKSCTYAESLRCPCRNSWYRNIQKPPSTINNILFHKYMKILPCSLCNYAVSIVLYHTMPWHNAIPCYVIDEHSLHHLISLQHNAHKLKWPRPKRPQTEMATNRNDHRPKWPQIEMATDWNSHKPKRPQTGTATNRKDHKLKRPQTEMATSVGTGIHTVELKRYRYYALFAFWIWKVDVFS